MIIRLSTLHHRGGNLALRTPGVQNESTETEYPLFVVIPKDDVIPKNSFFGIFTGNFPDLEISRDSA